MKEIINEFASLRAKLNSGLAKQVDVDRMVELQDLLDNRYHFTWDESFNAQFGWDFFVKEYGKEYK